MSTCVRFSHGVARQMREDDARIALFNWLFARHEGGAFALCIDDVGVPRMLPGAVDAICGDLRWLGLDWDRGPHLRSQRLPLYRRCVRRLVRENVAYPCYCSPGRLEQLRSAQIKNGNLPRYDGHCRDLSEVRRVEHEAHLVPAIRFRSPRGAQCKYDDLVLGAQVFESNALDDVFLLNSDGFPTPPLASVLDDHDLAITHVLCAQDRMDTTPVYMLLCDALGWDAPQFAHLPQPVDANQTGSGQCRLPLDAYREMGYLGPAVANHLSRLGWSPRGKRELLSVHDLALRFELCRVSHRPPVHDRRQLDWFNRRYLGQLDACEAARLFAPCWEKAYGVADRAAGTTLLPAEWQRALASAIQGEVHHLGEVVDLARFVFVELVERDPAGQAARVLAQPYAFDVLRAFIEGMPAVEPFAYDPIDAFVSDLRLRFKASHGIRSRDVMYVIRAALTGQLDGPCLVVACQLLGRQRCRERASMGLAERQHA